MEIGVLTPLPGRRLTVVVWRLEPRASVSLALLDETLQLLRNLQPAHKMPGELQRHLASEQSLPTQRLIEAPSLCRLAPEDPSHIHSSASDEMISPKITFPTVADFGQKGGDGLGMDRDGASSPQKNSSEPSPQSDSSPRHAMTGRRELKESEELCSNKSKNQKQDHS